MFYVVSLQLNAASEMSKALKDFLKGKQRIRLVISCVIKLKFTKSNNIETDIVEILFKTQ